MDSVPTTTTIPNVLTSLGLTPVSPGVSLYVPEVDEKSAQSNTEPTLIIICSWAFAQPKHIAKYIVPHQKHFPKASLLLVQNAISNAIWKPDRWQMDGFFQPAAATIQNHLRSVAQPRLLMHIFSNGGSHAAVQLSQSYRETCGGTLLPIDAIVFDSCPGQLRAQPTIAALTQGIPSKNILIQALGKTLAYASVAFVGVTDFMNVAEPAARKLWRKLNDPTDSFLLRRTSSGKSVAIPRTYICSGGDIMILIEDVKEHAAIAHQTLAQEGFSADDISKIVALEDFADTAHVNHVKQDPERYWWIVYDTWRRSI